MSAVVVDVAREPGHPALKEAAEAVAKARRAVAFTGAGISVESGIPDFRSPGGLWTVFAPDEYATIEAFAETPEKAWKLFRAIGKTIAGARPNPAHEALAALEAAGRLAGVITQNIDGLHQAAGSRNVVEVHGDHRRLQCLSCGRLSPMPESLLDGGSVPACASCGSPLKPNVVLFGEGVRGLEDVQALIAGCDLLLVVGTSAQVYPAAGIPPAVKRDGGRVLEFNLEPTPLSEGGVELRFWGAHPVEPVSDWLFLGPAGKTLPAVARRALQSGI
jgi:NAD-dependent deacetylase